MKGKKLISLLLSAALAASSVPMMMATAVSAADIDVDYEVIYTGTATEIANTASDGSNYYLHVGSRQEIGNTGLGFGFGKLNNEPLPAGTYFISFEGRFAVPGLNNSKFEPRACTRNSLTDGVLGKQRWWPTTNTECSAYGYGSNPYVTFSTEWTYFEWGFQLDAASDGLWFDLRSYYADHRGRVPFDIDNFSVYTFVESAEGKYILDTAKGVKTYKLAADDVAEGTTLYEKVAVFDTLTFDFEDGKINKKFNGINGAELSIEAASEYTRIASADSAPSVTIDVEDVLLAPGEYTLTDDMLVRYGGWNDYAAAETDNQFNAAVSVVIDGETYELAPAGDSVVYDCDWKAIGDYQITVEEFSTLEEIIITAESLGSGYVAAFDVKNEDSFALVADAVYGEVYSTGDETNLLDGAYVTYTGEFERESAYLDIAERTTKNAGKFVEFTIDETPAKDRTYYFGFMARSEVLVDSNGKPYYMSLRPTIPTTCNFWEELPESEGGYDGSGYADHAGISGSYLVPSENCEAAFRWTQNQSSLQVFPQISLTDEWQYVECYYTPTLRGAPKTIIYIDRGASEDYVNPIDIDDVVLYYYDENGDKVIVYENSFDTGVADDSVVATAEISVVPGVVTVTPSEGKAAATYVLSDVFGEIGTYTFSATVSSATAGNAWVEYTLDGDSEPVKGEKVAVAAYGAAEVGFAVELTADQVIKDIKIVTDIEDVVTIADDKLTYEDNTVLLGDANDDGKVNPLDVVYIQRYLAGWSDYADINVDALDFNGNGSADPADAMALARHIAMWKGYENLANIDFLKAE